MSFHSPVFLLLACLAPLALAAYAQAQRARRRYAVRFPAVSTLLPVLPRRPGWRRHLPVALFALALAALAAALARPQATVAVPIERASVVLITDVSRSMQASDVEPTRLEAARSAARRFLDRVPKELRVGLVAFSDTPQTLSTPTTDHVEVRDALQALESIAGTATGAGLRAGLEALRIGRRRSERQAPSAVVLLSDGAATDGDAAFVAAREARRLRIPIYTVALGTPDGVVQIPDGRLLPVPPDPEALRRISSLSGGAAFTAEDAEELDSVYEHLGSQIGTRREKREVTAAFAAGALVLLLVSVAGSVRWAGRLP
jgi:Ca-activated chloride channel homolog